MRTDRGLSSGTERDPDKAHFLIYHVRQRRLHKKLDGWCWLTTISGLKHNHLCGLGRAQVAEEAMNMPRGFIEDVHGPMQGAARPAAAHPRRATE
jgi:hypothetical protein